MKLEYNTTRMADALAEKLKILAINGKDLHIDYLRDLILDLQDLSTDIRKIWRTANRNEP